MIITSTVKSEQNLQIKKGKNTLLPDNVWEEVTILYKSAMDKKVNKYA